MDPSFRSGNHVDNFTTEEVVSLCLEEYKKLPKTGKPGSNEWTVLAAVIQCSHKNVIKKVVSIGCGTKCMGKSKLCFNGLIINDSHAEIMARRGFLRYIYSQLNDTVTGKSESIFQWCNKSGKFQLKPSITFHFLSTHIPCGDACIIPASKYDVFEPIAKKPKYSDQNVKPVMDVGNKISNRVYTGAKLLGCHHTDAMIQQVGSVRTKPGRGERTLSMSCSDKLAKWQLMGIQGALIDSLLDKPIYLETMVFGGEDCHIDPLKRAIWLRFQGNTISENTKYKLHKPEIRLCKILENDFIQNDTKKPSPNGIVWCNVPSSNKSYEICVNGKRQGITSKKLFCKEASLQISKRNLFGHYLSLLQMEWHGKLLLLEQLHLTISDIKNLTYNQMKCMNGQYLHYWNEVKMNYFKEWEEKSKEYQNFTLEL